MFVFFVGIVGLMCLLYWTQRNSSHRKLINSFPGPKTLPVFGNALQWSNKPEEMFLIWRSYAKKYFSTYRLWGGTMPFLNIVTADDAEIILSSTKHIKKGFMYDFIHPWLDTGLLTSEGKKWQQRRKILTPSFHFTILKRFVDIFNDHTSKLINELKDECQNPKTNVVPLITKCTLNAICETAMGINMDTNGVREKIYCRTVYDAAKIIMARTVSPWYYNKFIFDWSPIGWKNLKYVKILHDFTASVIKERQKNFQDSDVQNLEQVDGGDRKKRLAMLDLLIDAKNNKGVIDDAGIREEVDTFMFEGHDTTAMALCFALMVFANHKDTQEKIFEEIQSIFGDSNRQPTYNDLLEMKYLEMCLKESLRLYPSVPFISRKLTEDLTLNNGVAPSGCTVNIHIYDIHRDPKVFPEPEKFDPNRFSPENAQGRNPFNYVPFSAGPRNCIGQKFAMLEMKSIVSSIIRNYILEPIDTSEDIVFYADMILRNSGGLYVKFLDRT